MNLFSQGHTLVSNLPLCDISSQGHTAQEPSMPGSFYTPLNSSKNEIRLLHIFPSLGNDVIVRCRLFVYSLDIRSKRIEIDMDHMELTRFDEGRGKCLPRFPYIRPVSMERALEDVDMIKPINVSSNRTTDHTTRPVDDIEISSPGSSSSNLRSPPGHSLPLTYAAISYVWGSPTLTTCIVVNGEVTPVTKNLANALRRLQDVTDMPVWADAICINQQDVKEKNHQVQLMGQIYCRATTVFSWLDDDNRDNLNLGLRWIGLLAFYLNMQTPTKAESSSFIQKCPELLEDNSQLRAAISAVFNNPYWRRVWILQEVALAHSLIVLGYQTALNFSALGTVAELLYNKGNGIIAPPDFISKNNWMELRCEIDSSYPVLVINITRHNVAAIYHPGRTLCNEKNGIDHKTYELLSKVRSHMFGVISTCQRGATDPRDYVYASLGLFDADLRPDYERPVELVFCDWARWLLTKCRSLDFLRYAGTTSRSSEECRLPSWVPAWNQRPVKTRSGLRTGNYECRDYEANRGFVIEDESDFIIYDNCQDVHNTKLLVEGIPFAFVQRIQQPPQHLDDQSRGRALLELYVQIRAAQHPTGDPPLKVLFYTVMRATSKSPEPLDSDYASFQSLILLIKLMIGVIFKEDEPGNGCLRATTHTLIPDLLNQIWLDQGLTISSMLSLWEAQSWDSIGFAAEAAEYQIQTLFDYSFFYTRNGYIGLAPPGVAPDDIVCVLRGYEEPVILRKLESHYNLVGRCFMHGLMTGEAMKSVKAGDVNVELFEIQ